MTSSNSISLKDGDVYRWSYRDPGDDAAYGRYHCCSMIAIVHAGKLRDTYWQIGESFSDGRSFGVDALYKLNLTFLGNLSDFEKVRDHNSDYYADDDVMNLNHSNSTSGNFYLRKRAVRCPKKMLQIAELKLEQSKSDERFFANRSERLREAITQIKSGDHLNVYL